MKKATTGHLHIGKESLICLSVMSPLSLESICWPVEFLLLYPSLGTQYTALIKTPPSILQWCLHLQPLSLTFLTRCQIQLWMEGCGPRGKHQETCKRCIFEQESLSKYLEMTTWGWTCSVNYKTRLETNCQKVSYVTILYTNNEKVLGITLQIRFEVTGYINIRHTICKLQV